MIKKRVDGAQALVQGELKGAELAPNPSEAAFWVVLRGFFCYCLIFFASDLDGQSCFRESQVPLLWPFRPQPLGHV